MNASVEAASSDPLRRSARACPHCGSAASLFRSSSDINRRISRVVFHYYRCGTCGLVFIGNVPEDLAQYYAGGYQPIPADAKSLRRLAARQKYRLEVLTKIKGCGRLLEIGPWIGIFSVNAKDAGFEVEAIEGDQRAANFLREQVGINVTASLDPASTLVQLHRSFDAIVLWHSLEHLPTPWLVIKRAAQALEPGGVLLIALPNIDCYESRVMCDKWVHLDAPRHLYFYSPSDLTELCRCVGLKRLCMSTRDRLSLELGAQAWYRYLRRCTPIEYLRALVGLGQGLGSGFTAIFQKE